MTRNGCSTLARTLDFVRFLPRSTSSTMPRSVRVLRQPAIAHLGKAEHTLDDQKRMLDFGAHLGFRAVLAALHFIHDAEIGACSSPTRDSAPWQSRTHA